MPSHTAPTLTTAQVRAYQSQSRQLVGATTPQHVEVAALRNSAALVGSIRQLVPFDHRHRAVKLAEHPSGEQPAHPRTADDSLLSQLAHRLPPR